MQLNSKSFYSVPPGIPKPPSLRNICKELHNDIGMPLQQNGTLTDWAKQGYYY